MFSRVRLLLTISLGLLILAACGGPQTPDTGFEVAVTIVGDGNVTSTPAGIDTADGKTSANFAENAEVVLTAAPVGNATFTGWTGGACDGSTDATCTIADLTADTAVTATFTDDVEPGVDVTYTINVVNGGTATGTVTSSTGLVTDCADSCEDTAAENTTVTLTAAVTSDAATTGFAGWTGGDCEGLKTLECVVTVNEGEADVTANFNDVRSETITISEVVEELITGGAGDLTDFPPGHNYNHSGDLDFGFDDNDNQSQQWVGFRFDSFDIDSGDRIQSAVIKMVASSDSSDEVNVVISGENVAAPAVLVDDADGVGSFDASTRAANSTTATVAWDITDAWTSGVAVDSPDVAAIVQELSGLDGWLGGLVLFVSPDIDPTSTANRAVINDANITLEVEYVELPTVL